MMLRTLTICLMAALLGACATLDPEQRLAECKATDWERFGVNDGRLGVPAGDRTETFRDCADVGHSVDLAAYQAGRDEGLKEYCTAENGYRLGYENRRYLRVCPANLEPDFVQGYRLGREERPAIALSPSVGVGIGSRSGVSVGIGVDLGLFNGFVYAPYRYGYSRYGYPRYAHRRSRCRWPSHYSRLMC